MVKKNFIATEEMLSACKAVLMAEAWVGTVKPIVEAYQKKILAHYQFPKADKYGEHKDTPKIILDPEKAFRLSDTDFVIYDSECKKERVNAGLKVTNDDNCPLLEAESLLMNAKSVLVNTMKDTTGLDKDALLSAGLEKYNRYVELTMKLLVSYATAHKINLKGI